MYYLPDDWNLVVYSYDLNVVRDKLKNIEFIFYKTSKMKKPIFYNLKGFENDYKNCDINILKNWLKETYKIF